MPTLLDRKSTLLRNASIHSVRSIDARGASQDDRAKHFRHTISQAKFEDDGIVISQVSFEDTRDAPHKLVDWFMHSHIMDKYVMFVAWFCFWQTLLQTASCFSSLISVVDYFYAGHIGSTANKIYTFLYASFLLLYAEMETAQRPSHLHIFVIAIYTAGYASFALMADYSHSDAKLSAVTYNVGSWCFVTGSAALVHSSIPGNGNSRILRKNLPRYPGLDGSILFLIGSLVFASDAAGLGMCGGYTAIVGYAIFLAGRAFFVKASVTAWCDVCFQQRTVPPAARSPQVVLTHQRG